MITCEQALDVHCKLRMASESGLLAHYMNGHDGLQGVAQSHCDDLERHLKDVATRLGLRLVPIEAAEDVGVVKALEPFKAALDALDGHAAETTEIPDDWLMCVIPESDKSPSFKIQAGHIRNLAAAYSKAKAVSA